MEKGKRESGREGKRGDGVRLEDNGGTLRGTRRKREQKRCIREKEKEKVRE